MRYLDERIKDCENRPLDDPRYAATNKTFERALVHLHKMPKVWERYLTFYSSQKFITSARRLFDQALCALPVTQHIKFIWPAYIQFAQTCGVPETAMRIWRRYIKINPAAREDYVESLKEAGYYDEAAKQLADLLADPNFISTKSMTRHELWTELLKIIVEHPTEIRSLNVDAIIRSGIRKYPHEVARLWTTLADYYVRMGLLDQARDVYQEAIDTVLTVRDFTHVYAAYTNFEEIMIAAKLKEVAQAEAIIAGVLTKDMILPTPGVKKTKKQREREQVVLRKLIPAALVSDPNDAEAAKVLAAIIPLFDLTPKQLQAYADNAKLEVQLRMHRLETLIDSRPMLSNSVVLRQNPHNVEEWLKRIELCGDDILKKVQTFTQAVSTVDAAKATGKIQVLWTRFAMFYFHHNRLSDARLIFRRATQVPGISVESLSYIYCRWAEMELLAGYPHRAIDVISEAVVTPKNYRSHKANHLSDESYPAAERIYRHPKLWSLLADLHENFGSVESTKAVYEQIISLKVVTPQLLLNYAAYLEEHHFFEEAFRAYEKGISLFTYPHVEPIWLTYLRKFTGRFAGTKLERTRDLFEQAITAAPEEFVRKLYLLYAKYEEAHGLAKSVSSVYERACLAVPKSERVYMFNIYIAKTAELFGAIRTRPIFELALKHIDQKEVPLMAMRFAALEARLGEIDRARAIFTYAAQVADPERVPAFWAEFHKFESRHGNEDTFKDMLRIRRAVRAHFSQSSVATAAVLEKIAEKQRQKEQSAQTDSQVGAAPQTTSATDDGMSALKRLRAESEAQANQEAIAAEERRRALAEERSRSATDTEEQKPAQVPSSTGPAVQINPEEIDLDDL